MAEFKLNVGDLVSHDFGFGLVVRFEVVAVSGNGNFVITFKDVIQRDVGR